MINYFPNQASKKRKREEIVPQLPEGWNGLRLCGTHRVVIKYYVFFEDFKIFRTLAFLCFLSVSVCVHTPGR